MLILRSIQLGIRANFSRRWDTVVLTVQPVITFYLRITVIIATPGVGGGGSAQSQSKTRDVISAFPEQHVTIMVTGRPQQRLGRKSQNPSGRFQGAEGFHALATEIDASVTPDPEYMLKNKTT